MKRATFLTIVAAASICSASGRAQEVEEPDAPDTTPAETEVPPAVPVASAVEAAPMRAEEVAPMRAEEVAPMSAEELAALGLDVDAPAVNPDLEISGFADAGFSTILGSKDSYWRASGAAPAHSAFFVGNLNLLLHKELSASLRTTGEIRFSYLPNGSSLFGIEEPQNTTASDHTDFGRATRWGSIIIQRIYIDWTPHPLLTVRVGQFLSPYGVWNVDHGSPVFIPVRRPWSIGEGWIPEKQTGIELFGRAELSSALALGYHLTVSNGVGPISEYSDLDENKAIGGRLFLELRSLGKLRIGLSGYFGRETDASYGRSIADDGDVVSEETIRSSFDTLTGAADLTWEIGGLHIQTEWLVNQHAYLEEGRAPVALIGGGVAIPSDAVSWGGYGLLGYRLPWLGIMPFFSAEVGTGSFRYYRIEIWSFQGGVNIRPDDVIVLKASYEHTDLGLGFAPLNALWTQIAWSF